MGKNGIIQVSGLWKRYGLPLPASIKKGMRWVHAMRHGKGGDLKDEQAWALRDISFEVRPGATVGIMGRNGAGKSTLLKVLAGVTPPTRGSLGIQGSIFPMIELNAGIHPELTGRENVYLLGAVMGLSRMAVSDLIPEIASFCELGDWFEKPVRTYSSGMLARVGFGVAMNVKADVLLVDEVLAVGDLAFQRKCYRHMEKLKKEGTAVLLVSHNIRQVERLCETAMLLDSGRLVFQGGSSDAAERYYESMHENSRSRLMHHPVVGQTSHLEEASELLVEKVRIYSLAGEPVDTVQSGDGIRLELEIQTDQRIEDAVVGIGLVSTDLIMVASFSNDEVPVRPSFTGRSTVWCTIASLPLNPALYGIRVKVIDKQGATLCVGENLAVFRVVRRHEEKKALYPYGGIVRLDVEWA
jgi:ABC-type polysaccharide/polyol phosphate transport system ATPase subunit